jgi:hypothetical protein
VLRSRLPRGRTAETPYLPDELDLFEALSRDEGADALLGGGHDLGLRVLTGLLAGILLYPPVSIFVAHAKAAG